MIYTPQVVVDGVVAAKGSDRRAVEHAITRMRADDAVLSVPVKLSRDKDALVIEVDDPKAGETKGNAANGAMPPAAAPSGEPAPTGATHVPVVPAADMSADIWVCPVIGSQAVSIGRGENAGKTVTYTNIVRGWVRLGPWTGGPARYEVDLSRLQQDGVDQVVVMVQSGSPGAPGPILGAAKLALP